MSCTCRVPTPYTRPSGMVVCVNLSCGGQIDVKVGPKARP